MSQKSKRNVSNLQNETSFGEDYDMERERLPSSLASTFVGDLNSLDLLSQEYESFMMTDNEDDPTEVAKPPPNAESNVKPSDAAPSHDSGAEPLSNAKVSSFSVLSKSANDRKNKKAVYEFVLPNNNVKSGDIT